jgi:hypothetical protein
MSYFLTQQSIHQNNALLIRSTFCHQDLIGFSTGGKRWRITILSRRSPNPRHFTQRNMLNSRHCSNRFVVKLIESAHDVGALYQFHNSNNTTLLSHRSHTIKCSDQLICNIANRCPRSHFNIGSDRHSRCQGFRLSF